MIWALKTLLRMIDEHSGRILVDPLLAQEEEEKMQRMIAGWLK